MVNDANFSKATFTIIFLSRLTKLNKGHMTLLRLQKHALQRSSTTGNGQNCIIHQSAYQKKANITLTFIRQRMNISSNAKEEEDHRKISQSAEQTL